LPQLLNSTSKDDKGSILGWVLKYGAAGVISPTEFRRLVAMLLEAGCSAVQQCFVESIPPVALAAASGMKEVLQQLLDAGANLKATDGLKRNVLHYAAARGNSPVSVQLLRSLATSTAALWVPMSPRFCCPKMIQQ
jgi:ankyrin repeat protein